MRTPLPASLRPASRMIEQTAAMERTGSRLGSTLNQRSQSSQKYGFGSKIQVSIENNKAFNPSLTSQIGLGQSHQGEQLVEKRRQKLSSYMGALDKMLDKR